MDIIKSTLLAMEDTLTTEQLQKLERVLLIQLHKMEHEQRSEELAVSRDGWVATLRLYIASKRLENCAESTLAQYERCIRQMIVEINKPLADITTNDLRYYLARFQEQRNVSLSYLDTVRRYITAFFVWCQDEGVISANPARRLSRIKVPETIKRPFTAEEMAKLQDSASTLRDRAMIEVLYSTAARVSEVCSIDRADVDFDRREIIIYGQKGKKERVVYLTELAVYHLRKYLASRTDDNPALFVGLKAPHNRVTKCGLERMLRVLGDSCGVHCHPHKFRRTMLTEQGKRGVPLQEIQKYAGHAKPTTTMIYVDVSDRSVKASFDRLIA